MALLQVKRRHRSQDAGLIPDDEIQAYVATGDPLDKAGAMRFQHAAFTRYQNLQGCYAT